ncbi:class I SAM-dependent methyltransferase [Saccharolobus shibatae]|uniref:Putative SAM-dependent methyltransferase n=1 Tax=Saccharolobus shibatae TaxID=2286 RepID=A0A8F5BYK7_9CREN|nr:class I SAM-dependent methyltransferase [Saccharolobus shibatae]QXJ30823.1 putative SAM-dependent methyltransferase [Saccharolobus shibatae]QXJ33858.1 putative SAM-dependent methyltransferase [Saccharolobus shibatae]
MENSESISSTLKEIFNVDLSKYWNEAEGINNEIKRTLGNSFRYALSETKRYILYSIIKYYNPDVVIETGVGPGVSSTIILSALEKGTLHSIDIRESLENGKPVGFLVPEKLRGRWKLYIGRSRDILPDLLKRLSKVDIFLHDSEHTFENITFELNLAWDYLRNDGVLLVDNLDFTEAPYHFAKQKGVKLYELTNEAGGLGIIIKS